MDIIVQTNEIEIELPSTEVTLTDAEIAITLEPHHEFQITVERERPDICAVVGEIDLTIYGMSLIDWFNKNFAELDLQIIKIVSEHYALVQITLELKAFIEDPITGNTALADLLFRLKTEVYNHFDDQMAHAELFIHLQAQITANDGLISANADAIFGLDTRVTRHGEEITAIAQQYSILKADIAKIDSGHSALATALSLLEVRVDYNHGNYTAQATRLDLLQVYIDNVLTPGIDVNATALEKLTVRVTKNENGLTALARWTLVLTSEVGVGFFPWLAWEFETDLEGWQAYGSSSLTHSDNSMLIHGNGGAYIIFDHSFDGAEYPLVSLYWKRIGDNLGWDGNIWFKCAELSGWIHALQFLEPTSVVDYTYQIVDLTGTDWDGRTIEAIAITFSTSTEAVYALDSIGIGRRSATGAYGSIKKVTEAYVGEHFVRVGDFNTYKAQVGGEFASVNTELSIIGNDVDGLTIRWLIELDNNGRISGIYMVGTKEKTTMKFVVDQFSMYLPGKGDIKVFEAGMFDGKPALFMAGAIIKDVIRSENFRWGEAGVWQGWKLDPNGTIYAAGIQIKDSQGNEVLSSGSGINWDNLYGDSGYRLSINEHISPDTISKFFSDGSINPDQFSTYMESVGIQSAWIGEAVIGTAHIKTLSVDTNLLAPNSVTNFGMVFGGSLSGGGEGPHNFSVHTLWLGEYPSVLMGYDGAGNPFYSAPPLKINAEVTGTYWSAQYKEGYGMVGFYIGTYYEGGWHWELLEEKDLYVCIEYDDPSPLATNDCSNAIASTNRFQRIFPTLTSGVNYAFSMFIRSRHMIYEIETNAAYFEYTMFKR